MNGVLNFYKNAGMTSHDCVNKLRRIYKTKKVGHTGTLDPMATGVLPMLIGNAVKASEYIMSEKKTYVAGMRFGFLTDTEDTSGVVTESGARLPEIDEVRAAVSSFVGGYMQTPPIYSAIKKDGKKLYELARAGISVAREPRRVEIYSAELLSRQNQTDYLFQVTCSKGTYIRTLITDIAARLDTLAVMYSLTRTETCSFDITDAVSLERLETLADDPAALESLLVPVERVFSDLPEVRLNAFYSRLAKNGCEIYVNKAGLDNSLPIGSMVRFYDDTGAFFALARVGTFNDKTAVKPCKFFM